ncbi:MAG TPA: class I SAM-dependent methyltransferase [Capillimicrobium sp.]|nr:class I SAM-dependent methyltransferase [Capillimicrobium sp.]
MSLDAQALDDYARQYYLAQIDDLDIEELQQALSMGPISRAVAGAERVLEMGYGTGLTVRELQARDVPIEVLEGSPLLVEEARRHHPGLVVHEGLFETYAPGPVYDAVLALHIAEHVDDPRSLFAHVATWLRPGGRFVVAVPNAESLHRRLAVAMGLQERLDSKSQRDVLLGHQRVYTLDWLRSDVEAAGLRVVDELGWFIKTVPNSMMADYDESLLRALFDVSAELPPRLLANIAVVAER